MKRLYTIIISAAIVMLTSFSGCSGLNSDSSYEKLYEAFLGAGATADKYSDSKTNQTLSGVKYYNDYSFYAPSSGAYTITLTSSSGTALMAAASETVNNFAPAKNTTYFFGQTGNNKISVSTSGTVYIRVGTTSSSCTYDLKVSTSVHSVYLYKSSSTSSYVAYPYVFPQCISSEKFTEGYLSGSSDYRIYSFTISKNSTYYVYIDDAYAQGSSPLWTQMYYSLGVKSFGSTYYKNKWAVPVSISNTITYDSTAYLKFLITDSKSGSFKFCVLKSDGTKVDVTKVR